MKNLWRAALVAVIGLTMSTCLQELEPSFIAVTNITGVPTATAAGTDLPLTGSVEPSDATNKTIVWSIADAGTTEATIDNNVLKTTAAGTVTVTATVVNGASATSNYTKNFAINVTAAVPAFIPVTNITGIPSSKLINNDLTLTGTVQPASATNKTIVWSVTNAGTTGATIDNNVLKTAATGTVTVTATVVNGASATTPYTQGFTINVTAAPPAFIPVTNITGVPTTTTAGIDLPLTGSVEPSDATNKTIVWSIASAGTTGATITGNVLKTTAAGTATVTATIANGKTETTPYTQNFNIIVTPPFVAVTNITNVPTAATAGTDLSLTGTVLPQNATNKTIAWSIANAGTTGATIANGVLKTTAAGTATVTATITNGASETTPYKQNFNITVTLPFVAVTNITNVPTAATANTDLSLTGTVLPSNATNKTIVWSVTNAGTTGATIDNNVLRTTATGTATVTATITNGASATANYTKNFTITVTAVSNFNDISAAELVAQIKIGWNLGNTLDASDGFPANPTLDQLEMGWSNPKTTKAMITAIKNAGFNAIRIPISWGKAAGGAPNYTIRTDWMARVKEIVDYAVDNDMYIILNTHHDEEIFKFTSAQKTASLAAFGKIWEQIADTFKNYNEKLIFEGLNEPRTKGSPQEWQGGTPAEHAVLNDYYPVFIQKVRASGGNNGKRILMITPYAASATQLAVNALTLPADTIANKLVVSIHAYTPYEFCYVQGANTPNWSSTSSADTGAIRDAIAPAFTKFVSAGIPVIIGEFGAVNKNNDAARIEWAKYYVGYAKGKGIPCFIWDNGVYSGTGSENFAIFNRDDNSFYSPSLKDAFIYGVNNPITSPNEPTPPTITGNMGNYSFGKQENGVDPNYQQAVWTLTGTNLNTAKQSGAKLVLTLSAAPTADMQLAWQGPANEIWWKGSNILANGSPINGTGVTWNADTKTLTINLASALADYSSFTSQPSLNIIIAYYNGSGNINDLGIVSANLVNN